MTHALAIALLLGAAGADGAGQEVPATNVEVRFVDAVPAGPNVRERLAEIRRRIAAAVVYPPFARAQRVEGETLVRFAIERDGIPLDVVVHQSSGRPSLDRAAAGAVTAAAPLPWVYGRLEVPVRFELEARR